MKLLRSTLAAMFLATLSACSAKGGGLGGSITPTDDVPAGMNDVVTPGVDTPSGVDTPPGVDRPTSMDTGSSGDVCSAICARVTVTPGCTTDTGACMALCAMGLSTVPAMCRGQLDALLACGRTSPIMCSKSSVTFLGCTSQQNTLNACIGGTPPRDSGTTTDPCSAALDCESCTAGSSCGWCLGRCMSGTSSGPNAPNTCAGQPWAWLTPECSDG